MVRASSFPANNMKKKTEDLDPLAEITRIRVSHALTNPDSADNVEQTIWAMMEESLEDNPTGWSEITRSVMRGVVEALKNEKDPTGKIRTAAETAVLAVAKRWGNVVLAGKASVEATRDALGAADMDVTAATQQASLGAMEGALQAGPVCYPVLEDALKPMVTDFQQVLQTQRKSFGIYDRLREESSTAEMIVEWNQRLNNSRAEIKAPPVQEEPEEPGEPTMELLELVETHESAPLMNMATEIHEEQGLGVSMPVLDSSKDQSDKTMSQSPTSDNNTAVAECELIKPAPEKSPAPPENQKLVTSAGPESTALPKTEPIKPGLFGRIVGWFKGLFGKA